MNFFESLGPDIGSSLAGGATGGLAGFIQGLQLKQEMERRALENRKLAFPGVTALGDGAYLEHDPETGQLTMKQVPGVLRGGHQNYAINQFLENPTDPKNMALMDYIFKTSPQLIQARTEKEEAHGEQYRSRAELADVQAEEVPTTAAERRNLLRARTESVKRGGELSGARADTELGRQNLLEQQAQTLEETTPGRVAVSQSAAKANQARAERLRAQIENDAQLTPARKKLLESRASAAEAAAEKHRAGATGKGAENTVTISVDALGRPYVKPTFKKPEDAKAFLNAYQQWTQPLKNLKVGMFESKAESLTKIRKTWIEKNHPSEAEIAGFDQAMKEAQ